MSPVRFDQQHPQPCAPEALNSFIYLFFFYDSNWITKIPFRGQTWNQVHLSIKPKSTKTPKLYLNRLRALDHEERGMKWPGVELQVHPESDEVLVAQSPTLCDSMDCRSPGSSVHGISQIRILECVAISFPRGSSHLMDGTQASCIAGRSFTIWVTREAQGGSTQVSLKADISKRSITKVLFPKGMTHLLRTAVLGPLSCIIHTFFPNLLH